MKSGLSLAAAWFLVACTAGGAGANAEGEAVGGENPSQDQPAARSIEGNYIVTFVNGEPPLIDITGYEPTVTIEGARIHFQSQCIYDDWSYTREGERIETGLWRAEQAMCARGLAPGEEAIIAAFGGAETVRVIQGGLWFSGPGGDVQLERAPTQAELSARAIDLRGSWGVVALDGGDIDTAIPLEANFDTIWWEPGCAGQSVTYTIEGNAFRLVPNPHRPDMVCDIGYPPELIEVWTALKAADRIERRDGGSVLIAGGERSVQLIPREGGSRR